MRSPELRRVLLGAPRDIRKPGALHQLSLIALLAWVGLGSDGLSSSAYGPDEAFRALGPHPVLALPLALAVAATVFIIAASYRGIIEHFPRGGGGYVVATGLLGPAAGVVSGSALIIDYVLTVAVSIAGCSDQLFSFLPEWLHPWKLMLSIGLIVFLTVLNLRGVKESILILAPVFCVFLATHAVLIGGGLLFGARRLPEVAAELNVGFTQSHAALGLLGMAALLMRAFSMGAGTFTGIEAVSNGLQIMREPKVRTGKRTMLLMAFSLAITASGILVCYLLYSIKPQPGQTMNALLLERFAADAGLGRWFVIVSLLAEGALLCVAAQAGFIDGPRVMANMAMDGWLPRRYALLSDRLTMQNGVLLMGGAALGALVYTHGNITALVTMYSINVFLTFSLSMSGMCRFWLRKRREGLAWGRPFAVQAIALFVCLSILVVVVIEKFSHGAWLTLVVTSTLIGACYLIRGHYRNVGSRIRAMNAVLEDLPLAETPASGPVDPTRPVAVMLVSGYNGLGIHQLFQIIRLFPGQFRDVLFLTVGNVDSAALRGAEDVELIRAGAEKTIGRYIALAQRAGLAAEGRTAIGPDVLDAAVELCRAARAEFPKALFVLGKLVFERENWLTRRLHNETTYRLQRRLHALGMEAIVLPVRLHPQSARAGGNETMEPAIRRM